MSELKLQLLNNKKWLIMSFIIVAVGIVLFYAYILINKEDNDDNNFVLEKKENIVYTEVEMKNEKLVETKFISVDLKGRVKKPGVYRIDSSLDRRITDVITMAGGLLNDADTSVTNLSKKLFDEMVIIIYSKDEVKKFGEVKEKEEVQNNSCLNECDSCIENDQLGGEIENNDNDEGNKSDIVEEKELININTASKEILMTLSGIGESKAIEIIAYREITPFKTIEEIMNVSGIGESLYNKIKAYITV